MAETDFLIDALALPPTLRGDGRRTIPARDIVALLRLCGWALEPEEQGTRQAHAALDELIANGLPWSGSPTDRRFDPAEVINFVKLARDYAPALWPRYVATGRALLGRSIGTGSATPPNLAALPPRGFEVEIRRSFDTAGIAPGTRLRLRLPLPVESPRLRLAAVQPMLPEGAEHGMADGRLEVRMPRPDCATIDLAVRISFVSDPAARDETEIGASKWLRQNGRPIPVTPQVEALAEHLAAGASDPRRIAHAIYDRLIVGFRCGVAPYDRLPPAEAGDWVVETGWYDCRLAAALFVALCRARGVPARLLGGYMLWRVPTEHFWAEAAIDGNWLPFDFLGWDLSAGGDDPAWTKAFAGATDYRLTTQLLPDIFTGAPGIALPSAWHRLVRPTHAGAEMRLVSVADGRVALTEEVTVLASNSG
jgi:hypothetical protein